MINPYLAARLRHAQSIFRKQGARNLADACHTTLGTLADTTEPDEGEANRLIGLAFGDPIHA